MKKFIAFQGSPGAYSDLACQSTLPDYTTLPCESFEDAFNALQTDNAELIMMPVENSVSGRVPDVYMLLPRSSFFIIGEHYQPVVHHLLARPGTKLEDIKFAQSHPVALSQCLIWFKDHGIRPITHTDTAGAAADLLKSNSSDKAVVASELAGKIYGLESLAVDIADYPNNTTRFLVLAKKPQKPALETPSITSMVIRVRNHAAALYKCLGCFATNGINLSKLETYYTDDRFTVTRFFLDVEAHCDSKPMLAALDELNFHASEIRLMGTFPAHPFRLNKKTASS